MSTPINLTEGRDLLLNCLYRIARGSRDLQGYDPTAELATRHDLDLLETYSPDNRFLRGYRNHMLRYQKDYPIYKVRLLLSLLVLGHDARSTDQH